MLVPALTSILFDFRFIIIARHVPLLFRDGFALLEVERDDFIIIYYLVPVQGSVSIVRLRAPCPF